MKNKLWPFATVLIATLITSAAQVLYKLGVSRSYSNFSGLLNFDLFFGIFLYAVAGVVVLVSFKYGQVSVLYPLFASSYIWVSILSFFKFGETISMGKLAGIFTIILGVALIGIDSNKFLKSKEAV